MWKHLVSVFTWWNGQTLNTRLYTSRNGTFVGKDEFGNSYYRGRGIDPALGLERRWVIYNGESDGSATPPGWYGWLHHTVDTPPTEETYVARPWQRGHEPNATGTPRAYRPQGSTLRDGVRQPTGGDYDPWSPA